MFYAARDDEHVTGIERYVFVAEFHDKAAAVHEEHLVFVFMMMPLERAFELSEFDVLAIEFGGDARGPVVGEAGKGFGEVEFHERSYAIDTQTFLSLFSAFIAATL